MTVELAEYLIGLEKYVIEKETTPDSFVLNIQYPMSIRLSLTAPNDLDQNLLVDIKESEKKSTRLPI